MLKFFLLFFFISLFFLSCTKKDGIEAPRLDSVTVLSSSSGDTLIQAGESWARLSFKGLWDKSKHMGDAVKINGCTSAYSSDYESYTSTEIIAKMYFSGCTTPGNYQAYVDDGDSDTWGSASNILYIHMY